MAEPHSQPHEISPLDQKDWVTGLHLIEATWPEELFPKEKR